MSIWRPTIIKAEFDSTSSFHRTGECALTRVIFGTKQLVLLSSSSHGILLNRDTNHVAREI